MFHAASDPTGAATCHAVPASLNDAWHRRQRRRVIRRRQRATAKQRRRTDHHEQATQRAASCAFSAATSCVAAFSSAFHRRAPCRHSSANRAGFRSLDHPLPAPGRSARSGPDPSRHAHRADAHDHPAPSTATCAPCARKIKALAGTLTICGLVGRLSFTSA